MTIRNLALAVLGAASLSAPMAMAQERVLSIGGAVTEIVYALGGDAALVARDTTSTFPAPAQDLPDVGYMRALSPEGVLSVAPDLILAIEGAGPPETLAVLRSANVNWTEIPEGYTGAAITAKIRAVGDALDRQAEADALAGQVEADLAQAMDLARQRGGDNPRRVLFVLSTRGGKIMASGTGTAADSIITLSGAVNAVPDYEGYKTLTDEAVIAAAPDVILMIARGGDHAASDTDLLSMPAIARTPAGKAGKLVRMDGLHLLGFGPRTADAVTRLSTTLYGE